MSDSQTSPISAEALDEFIRQLFVCHWVLGQMIARMLERAQPGLPDAEDETPDSDAYSMIRDAIAVVVDRNGADRIEAATSLIDEVMDAISDDTRIFPPDRSVTWLSPDRRSGRRRVQRRRR